MTGSSGIILAEEDGMERGQLAGVSRILGPSWARLPTLTVGLLGVQILWSVEMSYASPYLVSLGLSKSGMAIVFIAGPLSGLIVQPMIGILSDNSKSRFGRRRPIILAGTILCCCATLLFGYTKPIASLFVPGGSLTHDVLTIWLAVLAIYCMDFAVNAVQALDRALLVDMLSTSEQPSGNAWAACMLAIGSVIGFYIGNIDLPAVLPVLGHVQLEVVAVIASLLLFGSQLWTIWRVKEHVLLAIHGPPKTLRQEVVQVWHTFRHLPNVIYRIVRYPYAILQQLLIDTFQRSQSWPICPLSFTDINMPILLSLGILDRSSWLGWFPFQLYTTLYIEELYKRSLSDSVTANVADVDAEGTRLGSRALFYSALVSLVTNAIAPAFAIQDSPKANNHTTGSSRKDAWLHKVPKVSLATIWAFSHGLFAVCMGATYFTTSVSGATFLVSLAGVCWAITLWAPFALVSLFTNQKITAFFNGSIQSSSSASLTGTDTAIELGENTSELELELNPELGTEERELTPIHRRNHGRRGRGSFEREEGLSGNQGKTGSVGREEMMELFEGWGEDEDGDEDERQQGVRTEALFDANLEGDDEDQEHTRTQGRAADRGVRNGHVEGEEKYYRRGSSEWVGDENEELINRQHPYGHQMGSRSRVDLTRGSRAFLPTDEQERGQGDSRRRRNPSGLSRRHGAGKGLSAQAGAILGIHNIFIVIPQFVVTGFSSIVFALLDPAKSVLHGNHPGSTLPVGAPGNGTAIANLDAIEGDGLAALSLRAGVMVGRRVVQTLRDREEEIEPSGPNAIAVLF
ncbi:hypothetical protein ID866_9101, partial [Astraeus odoratus]